MKRFALAAVAALSVLSPAVASAAVQVNLTNYSFPLGADTGKIHYATSPFNNVTAYVGQFGLTGNYVVGNAAASFNTYCVDIFHSLSLPAVFDIVPLSQMYSGLRAININKILANTNPFNADQSAAVQLALWEVAYETGSTFDVTSGAFYVDGGNSATARTIANGYLANLGAWQASSSQTATLLYSRDRQSQVFLSSVPEASTWAMMLMGFGAMGWAMRRQKRIALSFAA